MSECPTRPESERATHPVSIIRDVNHPAIRSTEKAVLWALASQLNLPKGRDTAYSSMVTIAKYAGLEESGARRVMNWLVQVGIVLEVEGPYRAKSRQIDLARLVSLPTDMRRLRVDVVPTAPDSVQGTLDVVTPSGVAGPLDHVHPPLDSVPSTLDVVHPVRDVVHPKNDLKNKTRTIRRTISAGVPPRSEVPIGAPLALNFGPADPPALATIPATLVAFQGPSSALGESLPVGTSNPPPNGKGKAGEKHVRKFTDEQLAARDVVYAFWKKTYLDELGVEPIVGNVEVGQMVQLLKKTQWNSATVCALIKNAFADVFFRERIKTIGNITANPSKYQTAPKSERRSSGQVEPPDDFFTNRDSDLAGEFGI